MSFEILKVILLVISGCTLSNYIAQGGRRPTTAANESDWNEDQEITQVTSEYQNDFSTKKHGYKSRRRILAACSPAMPGCSLCEDSNPSKCATCDSYYWKDASSVCRLCPHANCTTCTGATDCSQCDSPWISHLTNFCECPSGFFLDGNGVCTPCLPGCAQCTNTTVCQTCNPFFTKDINGLSCTPCVPNCTTCSSWTSCSLCDDQYVLEGATDKTCVHCLPGFYWIPHTCKPCELNCKTCDSKWVCTSCNPGRILADNKCFGDCPTGKFYRRATDICEDCPADCEHCRGPNSDDCIVCKPDYWKDITTTDSKCNLQSQCDDGYFRDTTGNCVPSNMTKISARYWSPYSPSPLPLGEVISGGELTACPLKCSTCDPQTLECIRCSDGFGAFLNNRTNCVQSMINNKGRLLENGTFEGGSSLKCKNQNLNGVCMICFLNSIPTGTGMCGFNCHSHQFSNQTECIDGDFGCEETDSEGKCTKCSEGYYLESAQCHLCHPSCKFCVNSSSSGCLECNPRYNLVKGTCKLVCEPGQYYDSTSDACLPGSGNCYTYAETATTCTSCLAGEKLVNGTCNQSFCPSNSYWNRLSKTCQNCDVSCVTCSGGGSSDCLSCAWGYQTSTIPGSCQQIPPTANCDKAWGTSPLQCIDPSPGYYEENNREMMIYTLSCDLGYYFDRVLNSCQACHASCYTCTGSSISNCSVCAEGYMRLGKMCTDQYDSCNIFNGYTVDLFGNCVSCSDSDCLVCKNKDVCTHCKNGMAPDSNGFCQPCPPYTTYCQQYGDKGSIACQPGYLATQSRNCTKMCSHRQYLKHNGNCIDCSIKCDGCFEGYRNCLNCRPGDYRVNSECIQTFNTSLQAYHFDPILKKTVFCSSPCRTCQPDLTTCLSCERGYFFHTGSGSCQPCDDSCFDCSNSATECTRCHLGFNFDSAAKKCIPICEKYEYLDSVTGYCMLCSPNCKYCDLNNKSLCLDCHPGLYLDSGSCKPCFETCRTCTSVNMKNCTSCHPGYTLRSGECVKECETRMFLNSSTYDCQHCHFHCKKCVGPTMYNCTECRIYYTWIPNTFPVDITGALTGFCKADCNPDQIYTGAGPNYCLPCHRSCYNCTSTSPLACITCRPEYYQQVNECLRCHQFCLTCNGPSIYDCTSCKAGEVLEPSGYCRRYTCGSGTYLDYEINECATCHTSCDTCFNGTASDCSTCSGTMLLLANNTCIPTCGEAKYYDSILRACLNCFSNCKQCSGPSSTNCTDCYGDEYVQIDRSCKAGCGVGSMLPAIRPFCTACHTSCANCTGTSANDCSYCYTGNYLQQDSTCTPTCDIPKLIVDGYRCTDCHENCYTCINRSISGCTSCRPGRELIPEGRCIRVCLDGFYSEILSDSCEICHPNCVTCSGPTDKDCTQCAGELVVNKGICSLKCDSGYFEDAQGVCTPCNSNCKECSGPLDNQCLQCISGLVHLLNGTCGETCKSGQFVDALQKCKRCHHSCLECTGELISDCSQCPSPVTTVLTEQGHCADCLNSPDSFPDTCQFHVSLQLSKFTVMLNLKASTTVKVGFYKDSFYSSRLTPELLRESTKIELPGLPNLSWKYNYRIYLGDILVDLFFSESVSGEHELKLTPNKSIVLYNDQTGAADLMFRNRSTSLQIQVIKAPNGGLIDSMTLDSGTSNKIKSTSSFMAIITSLIIGASSSGLSGPLLKLMAVFKLINRLKLINIYFGPYLEKFLEFSSTLFKLGDDEWTQAEVKANPDTRGKLNRYRITVITVEVLPLVYCGYFAVLLLRIYRAKTRNYAWGVYHLTKMDYLLNNIAEISRIVFISFVCIDIFFYSLHSVSHTSLKSTLSRDASISYKISLFFCIVIPLEFMLLFLSNSETSFPTLRREFREFNTAKARLTGEVKDKILQRYPKQPQLLRVTGICKQV